jgi:Na+-translocating ferredoxin:NAD+ oxidoreductase RnfC subunit
MKFIKKMVGIRLERKRKTAYSNIERMIEVDSIKLTLYGDLIKVVSVGEYIKKGQLIARGEITPSIHSPISG